MPEGKQAMCQERGPAGAKSLEVVYIRHAIAPIPVIMSFYVVWAIFDRITDPASKSLQTVHVANLRDADPVRRALLTKRNHYLVMWPSRWRASSTDQNRAISGL